MKKIKAQLGTIVLVVFVLTMWAYTHYKFKKAESYAIEVCEVASNLKNKDKIQEYLLSMKDEIKNKGGRVSSAGNTNDILIFFSGALSFDKVSCSLVFDEGILINSYTILDER